jgi:hypothetical protein
MFWLEENLILMKKGWRSVQLVFNWSELHSEKKYYLQNRDFSAALKTHHSIWKILFVLGADEYLERLEGKIRKGLFFSVKIF